MSRENLFTAFFFAGFFFLLYQLYLFLAPFSGPLLLAGVLVISFWPMTGRVRRWVRGSRSWAAVVMTLGTAMAVFVPMTLLLSLLAGEASEAYEQIQESVQASGESPQELSESWLGATRARLVTHFPGLASVDFQSLGMKASQKVAAWVAAETGVLAEDLAAGLFHTSMLLVALFFLFRDGDRIAVGLRELIPMKGADKGRIGSRLVDTVTAVMQSTVMIAVLQGVVAGLGYAFIGGLSVSVLLGFLTGVGSLVPVVGSAIIWAPAGIYLMVTGELLRGVLLVLWGVVAVGSVDNFVRPLVIGSRVEMPTFLLLFALLGGLQVYGFLGIFLAPVVVAVLIDFVEIYRQRYTEPAGTA